MCDLYFTPREDCNGLLGVDGNPGQLNAGRRHAS